MNIYVKLTGKTIETLRDMLGVNSGTLDLNKGLLRVNDQAVVATLAENQMIDNVNNQTYEQFLKGISKTEKTGEAPKGKKAKDTAQQDAKEEKPVELSAEERNKIIGWKPAIGSIIRTGSGAEIEHMVILAVEDEKFTTATVRLKQTRSATDSVTLKKGVDVLYKNPTYRDKVTVTKEITYGLTADQFKKGSGGMIVGKVIKMDKLQGLIDYAIHADESDQEAQVEA